MGKQTDNDDKPQGLMSAEAFQETKEALDDFATWWVNNYAPDVVDVVVEEHIPLLLAHIAAQSKYLEATAAQANAAEERVRELEGEIVKMWPRTNQ